MQIENGQTNYLIINAKRFNKRYSIEKINNEIRKIPHNSKLDLFIYKKLNLIVEIKYMNKEIYNTTVNLKRIFNYNILFGVLTAFVFLWIFIKSISMIKKLA